MTRKILTQACLISLMGMSGNIYAATVNDKLTDLHKRLTQVEESGSNVQVHGVVEVEYGMTKDNISNPGTSINSSDIVLATVELAIEATVNDNVGVEIVLLHEEDDTPLEVDVGVINLHTEGSPVSLSLGQMYVPFGAFDSNMVSDPLTLELGETRESAIQINYEMNSLSTSFYLFNGDIEEGADDDEVTKFGFSVGFENDTVAAGVDYISSISDTDAVQDFLAPGPVVEGVAGLSAHATVSMGTMSVIFEYVAAMDNYNVADMAFKGQGAEPSAMNLEFAMDLDGSTIAVGYQSAEEALAMGAPETRTMIAYSTELYESTSLGVEYMSASDYAVADGGTDESNTTFTVQLAAEF